MDQPSQERPWVRIDEHLLPVREHDDPGIAGGARDAEHRHLGARGQVTVAEVLREQVGVLPFVGRFVR
jgi:hypothetical protein